MSLEDAVQRSIHGRWTEVFDLVQDGSDGSTPAHSRRPAPDRPGALLDPGMMEHLGGAIPPDKSRETFLRQIDPAKADTTWGRVIVKDGVDVGTLVLWKNDHDEPASEIRGVIESGP